MERNMAIHTYSLITTATTARLVIVAQDARIARPWLSSSKPVPGGGRSIVVRNDLAQLDHLRVRIRNEINGCLLKLMSVLSTPPNRV